MTRTKNTPQAQIAHTWEPVDVKGLRDIACRKVAGRVCWPGSEVDIRTLLLSIVGRVKDGGMKVEWAEAAVGIDFKTRRFSKDSLFCLPRPLRHAGRSGLTGCMDLDQVSFHFYAQLARHPCRPALVQYVHERDAVLASVAGVCREEAKQLFLLLAYGGSLKVWQQEHGGIELPDFVHQFDQEQGKYAWKMQRSTQSCSNDLPAATDRL